MEKNIADWLDWSVSHAAVMWNASAFVKPWRSRVSRQPCNWDRNALIAAAGWRHATQEQEMNEADVTGTRDTKGAELRYAANLPCTAGVVDAVLVDLGTPDDGGAVAISADTLAACHLGGRDEVQDLDERRPSTQRST